MRLRCVIVLLIAALIFGSSVHAQSAPAIGLAWDYTATDEASIDTFLLQRRPVTGAYTDLQTLAKTLRVASDTTAVMGTAYCYRMYAQKSVGSPVVVYRSPSSNEACGVGLAGVLNLRLQ